jgi:isopropylmalate/homocitrate/citramalate synthase
LWERAGLSLIIVDETLREGMQSWGIAFTVDEKLKIFDPLVEAGVTRFITGIPVWDIEICYGASIFVPIRTEEASGYLFWGSSR